MRSSADLGARRKRARLMPDVVAQQYFPGPVWAAIVAVNVVLAALLSYAVVSVVWTGDAPMPFAWLVVLVLLAAFWWVMSANVFVLTVFRPRRTFESVNAASSPGEVTIPGSRRVLVWTIVGGVSFVAVLGSVAVAVAVAAEGGWRVFCILVIMLAVVIIWSGLVSARSPRKLVLTSRGLRACVFRLDAEVAWEDIARISYVQGMNGLMVIRVEVTPGAPSYVEHWRHPFARRRNAIDIEPLSLDLDPLLLIMALQVFWLIPASRRELESGRAPARLFSADMAVSSVPPEIGSDWLQKYRPRKQARF